METKVCSKCKVEKNLDLFNKRSASKDGYSYKNYEPFEGDYPDWALEAFQTLER